ncbi:MAG: hypothetical protein IIW52_08015 [Alistipes sp.]|nr:hypothetical protein [Alistipes sp.]
MRQFISILIFLFTCTVVAGIDTQSSQNDNSCIHIFQLSTEIDEQISTTSTSINAGQQTNNISSTLRRVYSHYRGNKHHSSAIMLFSSHITTILSLQPQLYFNYDNLKLVFKLRNIRI